MTRPDPVLPACENGRAAASVATEVRGGEAGYEQYRPQLGRYLRCKGVADHDVDDLVQEVLQRAIAGEARYEGRAKPLTWLIGIAFKVLGEHRRDRERKTWGTRKRSFEDAEEAEAAVTGDSGRPNPLDELVDREERARLPETLRQVVAAVERVLDGTRESDFHLVVLVYKAKVRGLTQRQVANALNGAEALPEELGLNGWLVRALEAARPDKVTEFVLSRAKTKFLQRVAREVKECLGDVLPENRADCIDQCLIHAWDELTLEQRGSEGGEHA